MITFLIIGIVLILVGLFTAHLIVITIGVITPIIVHSHIIMVADTMVVDIWVADILAITLAVDLTHQDQAEVAKTE